jgi:hypothetical protein
MILKTYKNYNYFQIRDKHHHRIKDTDKLINNKNNIHNKHLNYHKFHNNKIKKYHLYLS